jgi:hypothetical protein
LLVLSCHESSFEHPPALSAFLRGCSRDQEVDQGSAVEAFQLQTFATPGAQAQQAIAHAGDLLDPVAADIATWSGAPGGSGLLPSLQRFSGCALLVKHAQRQVDHGLGIKRHIEACPVHGYEAAEISVIDHRDRGVRGRMPGSSTGHGLSLAGPATRL